MPRMSNRWSRIVSVLFLLVTFICASHAFAQTAADWQLVWSDEFNGPAGSQPNPAIWTFTQGLTPDGAQSYNCLYGQTTNGCNPATPNVYLDGNGNLAIVARAAAGAPNGMTTGRIATGTGTATPPAFSTQYGRIEAGMTLPVDAGEQGVWPAFWMLGNNISSINWPSSGELDIMEYVSSNPDLIYGTLHGQAYPYEGLGDQAHSATGWGGYHVFGVIWSPNQIQFYVDSITNIYGTISTADIMANQPWVNGGLAAWPFNNPFYILLNLNMGGGFPGNVNATTTYPQTLLVDYVRVYKAAGPGAPSNVAVTANSQSSATLNWTASSNTDATYNVYRSSVSGFKTLSQAEPNAAVVPQENQTLIANNITGTSYTDANLAAGQTYYYIVTASGGYSGEAAAPQVQVTLPTSGVGANGGALYMCAACYSGSGAYVQPSAVSGGFTNAFTPTVDTSAVTNPAPQDVYHSERWGAQSWTLAHLTPGASYNVRMHFAEGAFGAVGSRQFNVSINGQQVLTNFDIYATAGAKNKVITQTINTVADHNGVILLQLAVGAADQPEMRAVDVTPSTGGQVIGDTPGSTTYVAINSGGPVEGAFEADVDAGNFGLPSNPITWGGGTNTTTATVSTAGVTNPAPAAVYQTERYGAYGYVFTSLAANSNYTVRLHMAEGVAANNAAGDRLFNVIANGTQVLTNYDIYAHAGAVNQAVIQQFVAATDEHGILSIQLFPGATNLPSLRGIEITQGGSGPVLPQPPTGLAGTAASTSQINLTWNASTTAGVTYSVVRNGATVTSNLTATSYSDAGLAASTAYTYTINAVNANGSAASNAVTVTTQGNTATPPAAPTGVSATAISSSQINVAWTASTTAGVTYSVFRNGTTVASNLSGTTYSDSGLTASTTYTYVVDAVDAGGTTASSSASATTQPGGISGTDVLDINAGGSATGSYFADEDFVGGTASATAVAINTSLVTNPAPQAVYQTERYGAFTYTLAGLNAGTSYTVNLHFAEIYWTAAGKREFNVLINGTQVLTNFDIFAAAGGEDIAIVKPFNATASSSGTITVQFATGAADLPKVSGIQVTAAVLPPPAPTGLTATAASASQINLSWTASTTAGVTYNVYRSTTAGFTPAAGNQIAASLTTTSYADLGLSAATTYYYAVEAINTAGNSAPSTQASATTPSGGNGGTDVLAINAGGAATGSFSADEDFTGGGTYSVTNTINTSATNAAPTAVYQSARQGTFTYTLPGLTAGASYTIRLHFAELWFTTAGSRAFDVTINGTPVLTNFDIVATAGAAFTAVVEPFTTIANSSGQIVVSFSNGSANQPMFNGVEVIGAASAPTVPNAPSGLTAAAASSSQINLSWAASSTSGVTYNVYSSTTAGFTPSSVNQVATGLTGTTYASTGLTSSTTYYYAVEAGNSVGNSSPTNQASATTQAGPTNNPDIFAINSGGAVAGTFTADEDFIGGGTYSVTNTINTSATNAAPAAVYQSARQGSFTYTLPGLVAGSTHTVRLHFAELYFSAAGQRVFNVSINGTAVLTNFDIVAAAGANDKAVVETFTATANSSGQIVITTSNGTTDQPMMNGIEVQ